MYSYNVRTYYNCNKAHQFEMEHVIIVRDSVRECQYRFTLVDSSL